ncbi:MAG: hypothetical protein GY878_06590 [Fuerstiella sp.]|nr:hypothetical protein [Fuerstiella sp.]
MTHTRNHLLHQIRKLSAAAGDRLDSVGNGTTSRVATVLTALALLTALVCAAQSSAQDPRPEVTDDFPSFESLMPDLPVRETSGTERGDSSSQFRTFETPFPAARPADERSRMLPLEPVRGDRTTPTDSQTQSPGQLPLFGTGNLPVVDPFRDPVTFGSPAEEQASQGTPVVPGFDWTQHSASIADLKFTSAVQFQHGVDFLTTAEEFAYLDLIDAIADQRRLLLRQTSDKSIEAGGRVSRAGVAAWELAFYEYSRARRRAWENGNLRSRELPSVMPGGLPDPFRPQDTGSGGVTADSDAPFEMLDDIARFPEEYVGRPIVLYGRFTAESIVRIAPDQTSSVTIERDVPRPAARQEVRLLRGSLTSLDGLQPKALIDTRGLMTPLRGRFAYDEWPSAEPVLPVMVKGWVVKQMGGRPLVYCETIRQLSAIPHFELVRQNTVDKHRLRDEETWLYYETLRQLELTSTTLQRDIADDYLQRRIGALMQEVNSKTAQELVRLGQRLKSGSLDDATYRRKKVALQRQLDYRIGRYRRYRENPQSFQTYVDMFQFPDVWHGHLVTLQGHVRHMVTYPSDERFSDGRRRKLHELWLFTDDSQHNPAVIVTANLPPDFPLEAEILDRVQVTGCFFKRYVYGSQDTDRIAPLILAGTVSWEPTVDQVQALVAAGHLSEDSPRAVRAAEYAGSGLGNSALVFVSIFVVLTLMILWGRNQREERDRIRLRKRVSVAPEFENPQPGGYSGPLADFNVEIPGEYPA